MIWLPPSILLAAGRADDHPVARRGGEVISFARLRADVAATVGALRAAGCRRGGLVCADAYLFAVGLLALAHAGAAIVVPPSGQHAILADLSGAWDTLVTDDPTLPRAVVPGRGGDGVPLTRLAADEVHLDFFTSGTTSQPKRVARTLAQFEAEAAMLDGVWGGALGPALATVPHQHVYGLTFRVLWPMAAGRPFSATLHEVWESLLAELSPDAMVVSSPAHLSRLGGFDPVESRPRLVLSAGAPLPPAAARECLRVFGVLPTEIYGSTETGAIAARRQETPDALWRALPGAGIRREDDGRLSVRLPWIGAEHWVATEDRIDLSLDGGFSLLGRADRVVKIEGKRVSLPQVEAALMALPQVADVAAIALSGTRDEVAAVVVPSPAGRAELDRLGSFRFGRLLRAALADRLEPLTRPRRWRFVDAIPETAMGKRSQALVAALFDEVPQ